MHVGPSTNASMGGAGNGNIGQQMPSPANGAQMPNIMLNETPNLVDEFESAFQVFIFLFVLHLYSLSAFSDS